VRDDDLRGVDLSSWKQALNGAEPISPEILRRFADRFARFGFDGRALTPVYGLSEASLAVTFAPHWRPFRTRAAPGAPAREMVSVGVPVPGAEVRIAGDRGDTLDEGRVGRVLIRSPSVMDGYFQRPDATREAMRDGWLDSGDVGLVDEGELFLCGREKELVILRGQNHAPQEFEEALDGIDGLRAGCAVAVGYLPQGADGEELAVLAEVDERSEREANDLINDIRGRVAERTAVRPYEVKLLAPGTLPRTSSGKLRRAEALRQLLAGELKAPKQVSLLRIGGEMARSMVAYARLKLLP
jgi:acyl-CoA synthetase (AMP-forming)/AMP-acid ligase II